MNILVIAHNTFLETIRDHILRVIVGLSLVVIATSRAIGTVSLGQDIKIIADMSLGAMDLFGVILCVFIGAGLIYKEVDKRTLYVVLSSPLQRSQFIIGKYLGMMMTLGVAIAIMGSTFWLFFLISGGTFNKSMLGAMLMLFFSLMLLNAIAVLFSTMSSPTVSAISTIAIFVVGRATYELKFFADQFSAFSKSAILFFYYALPNFNNFNHKIAAVHNFPVKPEAYYWAIQYGLVYTTLVLFLACLIFQKRNL